MATTGGKGRAPKPTSMTKKATGNAGGQCVSDASKQQGGQRRDERAADKAAGGLTRTRIAGRRSGSESGKA